MSLHINRFLDRVKAAEGRGQREIVISLNEARDLHTDLTKLLLALQVLQEKATSTTQSKPTEIEVSGGSF